MEIKKVVNSNIMRKVFNLLFIAMLLLVVFNADAKTWVLRQLMAIGLFKAEIKKDTSPAKGSLNNFSFGYRDERGQTFTSDSLKGKVVFINFWATWCPPCRAEMASLNQLYNQLKGDNRIVFLFINEDDDFAKAKTYMESTGYNMPLLWSTGNIPVELYSGTLPTTIVLNKEGNIVMKHEGIANYGTNEFLNQLKELYKNESTKGFYK